MLKKIFILSGVLVLLLQMPLCAAEQNNITADSNTGNILNRIFGGNNRRYYNNDRNRNYNYDNNYNRNDNRRYNNNNNDRYNNRRRNNNR